MMLLLRSWLISLCNDPSFRRSHVRTLFWERDGAIAMRRFAAKLLALASVILPLSVMAQSVDGAKVLDGLGATADDIAELESGDIIAYSDEAYESTPRELAVDAVMLVDTDMAAIVEILRDAVTVIPTKLMIEHSEISSRADFSKVAYTEGDIDEVEKLFKLKAGKDFNLSAAEFDLLKSRLGPHRNASNSEKIAVASDAMREILLGRYKSYRAQGLAGVDTYWRSKRKQIDVGREIKLTTDTFEPFAPEFPEFFNVMENYPSGADCCEHYFRWLKIKIHKRPAFALAHTMVQKTDQFILYTERFYYVNNTINSVQVTLSWLPYDHNTYMGLAMSASADILDSMLGKMLRPLGRNKGQDLVTDVMTEVRQELEEELASADSED